MFQQRSRCLQLLAWVNDDQTARMPLAERRDTWERFAEAHPPGSLLLAPPSLVRIHNCPAPDDILARRSRRSLKPS